MRAPLVLLVLLCAAAPCAAEELVPVAEKGAEPKPSLAVRIGSPADPVAVLEALDGLDRRDPDAAVVLARTLAECGGHGAAAGLRKLVRHLDRKVQLEALAAAGDVGLRDAALLEEIRVVIIEDKPDLKRAACHALGSIGEGEDVETLLALAADEDVETRLAAFRALRSLSGKRIPFVLARWQYWWRTASRRAKTEVTAAIHYLEDSPEGTLAPFHEDALLRSAWIVLPDVRTALGIWLTQASKPARARACRIAGELGLVEFLDEIRSLQRFAFNDELESAATMALEQLGATREDPEPSQPARRNG